MNTLDAEALLSRLPAYYRERDEALGGPLAALLAVMAEQGEVLLQDLQRLYDDAFIETCDEALVPYIGDLLGVRPLHAIAGTAAAGQRALVANTLRLRRRKGTLPVLEEVALAATGWRASAMGFSSTCPPPNTSTTCACTACAHPTCDRPRSWNASPTPSTAARPVPMCGRCLP